MPGCDRRAETRDRQAIRDERVLTARRFELERWKRELDGCLTSARLYRKPGRHPCPGDCRDSHKRDQRQGEPDPSDRYFKQDRLCGKGPSEPLSRSFAKTDQR